MDIGPVKFTVEGTFTDKPRLLMDGIEVDYDSLYITHEPSWEYEEYDGSKKTVAARTHLDFSVKASVGQLEANVTYRVKANEEGKFVLAKVNEEEEKKDKKKPPFFKKKNEKKGNEEEKKHESCAELEARIPADPGSSLYYKYWNEDVARNLAK